LFDSSRERLCFRAPTRSTIIVDGQEGYLFEGEKSRSFCFVPVDLVHFAEDGSAIVDEVQYFQSGWALWNMRRASIENTGPYLFPNTRRLISDFNLAGPKCFLSAMAAHSTHPFSAGLVPERIRSPVA
jgi:hypothetical protein